MNEYRNLVKTIRIYGDPPQWFFYPPTPIPERNKCRDSARARPDKPVASWPQSKEIHLMWRCGQCLHPETKLMTETISYMGVWEGSIVVSAQGYIHIWENFIMAWDVGISNSKESVKNSHTPLTVPKDSRMCTEDKKHSSTENKSRDRPESKRTFKFFSSL